MWNCIPADTRAIQSMDTFKSKITQLMLSVPDTPPIRGYTPINSNSILEWRNNRDASALCFSGAVEEFDGLSNLEEATQRYQR